MNRGAIDDHRWNDAVNRDNSCLPYGFTWWLDAVTNGHWQGLVLDDYRVVLPLPYERRIGPLRKVARGAFTQQTGPWGNPSDADGQALLSLIPSTSYRVEVALHERLTTAAVPAGFMQTERTNLVLDLRAGTEAIQAGYHKSVRRKLRRATGEVELRTATMEEVIQTFQLRAGLRAGLRRKHYRTIRRLFKAAEDHGMTDSRKALVQDGQLLATGFFPSYRGRIINLFPASTALGYKSDGMLRFLDKLFHEQGPDIHTFDFEGSTLPGIARFFRYFGASNRPYQFAQR